MKKNKVRYYLKKLIIPFFLLSLALAALGSFQVYHNQYSTIWKEIQVIVYSIFKLFTFFPTVEVTQESPLAYELATWMAPASTMVGFFTVFKKIQQALRLTLMHLGRDHMVIMGANDFAIQFMKNIAAVKGSPKFYCLVDEGDEIPTERLQEMGVKIIRLDYQNPSNVINAMIAKDFDLDGWGKIICFEPGPRNYGRVRALHTMLGTEPKHVDVYLMTDHYRIKELVEQKMDELKAFDIHYFQVDELLVRQLLETSGFRFAMPPEFQADWQHKTFAGFEDIAQAVGSYRILIVGFSPMAKLFLMQAANQLTLNPLTNLHVTIVDENISEEFKAFHDDRRMLHKVIQVDLIEGNPGSRDVSKQIAEAHAEKPFSGALFANEDFQDNILELDKILEDLPGTPIAIFARQFLEINTLLDSLKLRHPEITVFGDPKTVLTRDIILNETMLEKAKDFNAYYTKVMNEVMGWPNEDVDREAAWRSLSNIKKESSEYQVAHQKTKWAILEKFSQVPALPDRVEAILSQWQDLLAGKSVEEQIQLIEKDPYLNYMTALEHKRWNNFYYMRGFRFSDIKDEKNKTHDCLIDSWEDFLAGKQRPKAIYDTLSTLSLREHQPVKMNE